MTAFEEIEKRGHAGETAPVCPVAHSDTLNWFKYLREHDPVHKDEEGRYILTRYEDIYAALRTEPELWSSAHELTPTDVELADARWVVWSDDPEHTDWRKIANRGMTPAAVAELESSMRANAAAVLDPIQPGEEFDLVQMGIEFSFHNWADASGLPPDQHARLKTWAPAVGSFVRPLERRPPQPILPLPDEPPSIPGHTPGFVEAYRDMEAFWSELVATHRDHDPAYCKDEEGLAPLPRAIVASVKDEPEKLSIYLRHVYPTMWAGGTSTVAHLFANAVDVLLDNPDVWTQLREDRSPLDPNRASEVIEEILRLRGPHPGLHKRPARDVDVRGTEIPAGAMVQMYYLSANRDPAIFENPDEFKLRGLSRHLTFGFGTHTCIGQSFARLALKVFLDALLDKFETIERAPTPSDWTFKGGYFTPDRLHVIGDPHKRGAQRAGQQALKPAAAHVVL